VRARSRHGDGRGCRAALTRPPPRGGVRWRAVVWTVTQGQRSIASNRRRVISVSGPATSGTKGLGKGVTISHKDRGLAAARRNSRYVLERPVRRASSISTASDADQQEDAGLRVLDTGVRSIRSPCRGGSAAAASWPWPRCTTHESTGKHTIVMSAMIWVHGTRYRTCVEGEGRARPVRAQPDQPRCRRNTANLIMVCVPFHDLGAWTALFAGHAVAVGTALAGGPPHRSQRAGLPHWAPTLGGWRRSALRETGARCGSGAASVLRGGSS
jgi:hypothetical protein